MPGAALPVRGLGGGDGEAAGERQEPLARPQEPPPQRLVGDDREGEVEAGQVERLARRHERDDAVRVAGARERRRHVVEVVEDEVAVDLVADAARGRGGGRSPRPPRPRPAARRARAGCAGGRRKHAGVGRAAASRASSGSSQRPSRSSAGTVTSRRSRWSGRLEERRVDRRDGQHRLAGRRERVAGQVQPGDDARQPDDPLVLDAPAVAPLEVGDDRLDERVGDQRVAEHAVGGARLERLDHRRRRGEVHVRDPQRQHVVAVAGPT